MNRIILLAFLILTSNLSIGQSMSMIWANAVHDTAGSFVSIGEEMKLDAVGNSYTVGMFSGTMDFDPGSGVFLMTTGSATTVFLLKLDASGNFVWAKKFPSTGDALTYTLDFDASGNIIIAGDFKYTIDLDPGMGTASHTAAGTGFWQDVFIVKLDPSGNYLWSKSFGGIDQDEGLGVVVDHSGNIYTTGIIRQTVDLDPGAGTYTASVTTGGLGIYVQKLNPSGNFIWAKTIVGITGPDGGVGRSIAIDDANNVIYCGQFTGTLDFDPGAGTSNMTAPTGAACATYVSKLDSLGNFLWAKKMGGTGLTAPTSFALDKSNNIYTTGWFSATADFDPGTGVYNLVAAPNDDVFISKLGPLGDFAWAKKIGGSKEDHGMAITTDSLMNVYTTGYFSGSVDFNPGAAGFFMTSGNAGGDIDTFISKLDSTGAFVMAAQITGDGGTISHAMQVDQFENIFLTGLYGGIIDFDPGSGVYNLPYLNTSSIFIEKLHQSLLGLTENDGTSGVKIYPNPSSGSFTLTSVEYFIHGEIEIYNSIGMLVMTKGTHDQIVSLDLTDEADGLYFVKVISDGKIIAMKTIVKE